MAIEKKKRKLEEYRKRVIQRTIEGRKRWCRRCEEETTFKNQKGKEYSECGGCGHKRRKI